jgi:S-DNA-T family DNA segregation ATPase FtsK/SpoIIIE
LCYNPNNSFIINHNLSFIKMPAKTGKSTKKRSKSTQKASSKSLLDRLQLVVSPKKASSQASKKSAQKQTGLSLDRKLDIAGVILILVAILITLGMVSSSQGSLMAEILLLVPWAFGWGGYLLPLGLFGIGLWLVIRNFKRVPQVSPERLLGIVLLFFNLLVWLHLLAKPENASTALEWEGGQAGGFIGAIIYNLLIEGLGAGGTVIALLAWLIIALTLAIDIAVATLFSWFPAIISRIQDAWDDYQTRQVNTAQPPNTSSLHHLEQTRSSSAHATNATGAIGTAKQSYPTFPTPTRPTPQQWALPSIDDILIPGIKIHQEANQEDRRAQVIEETLASFGAPVNVIEVKHGPTITLFGVEPAFIESRGGRMRVRVGKITSLADDLALALSARTIRIQAPVPGKGYVGIEVPNDDNEMVALHELIEHEAFRRLKSPLRFALGKDVAGNAVAADLAAMPHLLVAGTTGSGKSVCINSLVTCLLLHNTPNELRMLMVDPKRVELSNYNGIPHLLAPVVVELERVVAALQWVTREMDQRYHKLAQAGARNITEFNARATSLGERPIPYLVIFIDELADLMMLAPDETERNITRLAQLARATGIHLVISTQRPSVDVVTGLIKANFPARIAFAVASGVDSRVILDQPGAERLLGKGDMLFQAPDAPAPVRLQGTYVSDQEIQGLVDYWRQFAGMAGATSPTSSGVPDALSSSLPLKQMPLWEELEAENNKDPLFSEAVDLCRREGRASISMLQRRLRIGYTRAARLIENMEENGIVGPPNPGTGARDILDYGPAAPPAE